MPYYPQMLACVFHKQGLSPRQPPNGLQQQESTSIPYQHLLSLTHSVSPTLLVASLIARHPAQNHMLLLAVTSLYFLQLRNVPHLSLTFISLTLFFFPFHSRILEYGGSRARSRTRAAAVAYSTVSLTLATAWGNTTSLTHWAGPGIEPTSSQRQCWVLNPLSHNRNSLNIFDHDKPVILWNVLQFWLADIFSL